MEKTFLKKYEKLPVSERASFLKKNRESGALKKEILKLVADDFANVAAEDNDVNSLRELGRSGYNFTKKEIKTLSLTNALKNGNADALKALHEEFGFDEEDIEDYASFLSKPDDENKIIRVLRVLKQNYDLDTRAIFMGDTIETLCEKNFIRALRFIVQEFDADESWFARTNCSSVAVRNGNFELLTFLRDECGQNPDVHKYFLEGLVFGMSKILAKHSSSFTLPEERRLETISFLKETFPSLGCKFLEEVKRKLDDEYSYNHFVNVPEGRKQLFIKTFCPPQREPEYFPTQTESTTFLVEPPLAVDYDVRTSKCFDLIMLDEEAAVDYLEQNDDNVIILNKPEGVAICFTRSGIQSLIDDRASRFIECLGPEVNAAGDKGQRWIKENPPLYVKVPVNPDTGTNAFIPIENLREAITSEERVFCLVPLALGDGSGVQASLSHTITETLRRGEGSAISANHCQRGSNVLLYKFVRCRFVEPSPRRGSPSPRRSPSPSPRHSPSPRRRSPAPPRATGTTMSARRPCPVGMLWNPRTQRCIKDTPENRRRLGRNARR